jgi:hypothetical protein
MEPICRDLQKHVFRQKKESKIETQKTIKRQSHIYIDHSKVDN